jgi:hypothetical protein
MNIKFWQFILLILVMVLMSVLFAALQRNYWKNIENLRKSSSSTQ